MRLADILEPRFADPEKTPPSPLVPFHIGQKVAVHKIGWAGWDFVTAIRGEHVHLGTGEWPIWFHYTELRAL